MTYRITLSKNQIYKITTGITIVSIYFINILDLNCVTYRAQGNKEN